MPRGKKLVFFGAKMKLLCDVDAPKGEPWDGTRFNRVVFFLPREERQAQRSRLSREAAGMKEGGEDSLVAIDLIDR